MPKVCRLEVNLHKPDRDLFSNTANIFAKLFHDDGVKLDKNGNKVYDKEGKLEYDKNTRTQLRGFYDEIVNWNDKIGIDDDIYKTNEPLIRMFLAKVAYSKGRNHITQDVQSFMVDCFQQIDNAESFNNFRLLFEAIMGYYAGYRSK